MTDLPSGLHANETGCLVDDDRTLDDDDRAFVDTIRRLEDAT